MTLVKFVTFVVLKILDNLVSMQIIADVSKISKTVQPSLIFSLNVLSISSIYFIYLSIVLAKKNVGIFT